MSNTYNPFKGANDAQVSEGSDSLGPGRYLVEIVKCSFNDTFYGPAYFANFKVLESSNSEHPVGSERKWKASASVKETFNKSVKAFCIAACGLSLTSEEHAEKRRALDSQAEAFLLKSINENCFKGRRLCVDVAEKTSKEGRKYNVARFSPG